MSWKESKVRFYSPAEDRILSEKKPDIQDLLLLGQAVTSLPAAVAASSASIAATASVSAAAAKLPRHPVKLEALSSTAAIVSAAATSAAASKSSLDELAAMPPPPPPGPLRNPVSPPTSVSSTSSEDGAKTAPSSATNRTDIEFDGNDQVLCRVCGDKASGFHYGVHSCEGCKGFFRRSIQQKIQYRPCTKNQQCNILRINRNRCQYCRLKKCIAAGMSRDAVRFGRVPKREKAKILAAMQSSRMKTQESKVLAEMTDDGKIIETIVRAHYDTCDYTRNKIEPFMAKARSNPSFAVCTGATCPMKGRPEDSFLEQFSERFMDHVRQVCTFAKLIPGFKCLHHDDQVTLLKSCVFEVLLVRLAGLFDNGGLVCLNGDIIRKDTINQMPQGNPKFLMDSVFELAQRLNTFRLSDAEIGLFCAVVIITADRPGLRNPELVQKMQNKLKMVLSSILLPQHPEHASIFSELMTMIHDLRTLNTLHTEKFLQQCKVNNTQIASVTHHQAHSQQPLFPNSWPSHRAPPSSAAPGNETGGGSTGDASPHSSDIHSSTSTEDQLSSRRSPMASSVSSSESICTGEIAKLTGNDLRVNGSVLMNALTIPASTSTSASSAATITITRKRVSPEKDSEIPSTSSGGSAATVVSKIKVRKLDSPSDSGIDSPKAGQAGSSNSTNTSVCSSPRSSMEEEGAKKEPPQPQLPPTGPPAGTGLEEQHPLLKRELQQPPQPYNNMPVATFQDEVYKPHKKFRRQALSSGDDCPSSSTQSERASPPTPTPPAAHSTLGPNSLLVSQLTAEPIAATSASASSSFVRSDFGKKPSLLASTLNKASCMAQEESKRNEILANLILNPTSSSTYQKASQQAQAAGLLMCVATSTSNSTTSTSSSSVALSTSSSSSSSSGGGGGRHIPVQAAPTKTSESKMSQLAVAAAALAQAEAANNVQPLNLCKRSPSTGESEGDASEDVSANA